MINTCGFGVIHQLANNKIGEVSVIGEMSANSESFSKEKGHFAYDDLLGIKLHILSNKDANDLRTQTDAGVAREMAEVLYWIANKILTHDVGNDKYIFLDLIRKTFNTLGTTWDCGEIVYDGTHYSPEWVSWTGDNNLDTEDDVVCKVWLVDQSFQAQFLYSEFTFTFPLKDIDDLHKPQATVIKLLEQETLTELLDRAAVERGDMPATKTTVLEFECHSKLDADSVCGTRWPVAIYGRAGLDADVTRLALSRYILANSSYSEFEWNILLPDLFTPTEYIIIPQWDKTSLTDNIDQPVIYSPICDIREVALRTKNVATDYDAAHIDANVAYMQFVYKSLGAFVVGSIKNKDNLFDIRKQWPTYLLASSLSSDYARMSPELQQWVTLITRMLKASEEYTGSNTVPADMAVMIRNGFVFITSKYKGVNYNVLSKYSFTEKLDIIDKEIADV